jgi:hypothetical protein
MQSVRLPYDFSQPNCGSPVTQADGSEKCVIGYWERKGADYDFQHFTGFGYHVTQPSRMNTFADEELLLQGFKTCTEAGDCIERFDTDDQGNHVNVRCEESEAYA